MERKRMRKGIEENAQEKEKKKNEYEYEHQKH